MKQQTMQQEEQQFKSFSDIEVFLIDNLKQFDISESDFYELIKKIKSNLRNRFIKEYNLFNIQGYKLVDDYSDSGRVLNKIDNIKEFENFIKKEFSKFTKDDRISELMFRIDCTHMLNKGDKKFYSWYDLKLDYTKEQFVEAIKNKCSKEIRFSCWGLSDKYTRSQRLRELKELVKVMFDIDLVLDIYSDMDLKTVEGLINKQKTGFKVRLFKEWFYLSFEDKTKHNLILDYAIKREVKTYMNN